METGKTIFKTSTDTPSLIMNTLAVIYEDDSLLVIDKPAGVIVNKADTTQHVVTVQDWAEEYLGLESGIADVSDLPKFGEEGWNPETDFYRRGGIVHRLDKETSGILLIAKTPSSFVELQKQFRERNVKKVYHAFAHGEITPHDGEINVPVGRLPWNKKSFGIVPGGKESKTLYQVLDIYTDEKTKERLSLVELYPQSGRTHQIRVHLKYINHPIFADFLYAGRKTSRNDRKLLDRVFLHAAKISFVHPETGEHVTFSAPLPQELSSCLDHFVKI